MSEIYTVEHYRAQFAADLTLPRDDAESAAAYLKQLAALWRAEGYLVSCIATEREPLRLVGQSFTADKTLWTVCEAYGVEWTGAALERFIEL